MKPLLRFGANHPHPRYDLFALEDDGSSGDAPKKCYREHGCKNLHIAGQASFAHVRVGGLKMVIPATA